jgi:MFS superfamily sulfate permease-like transporter
MFKDLTPSLVVFLIALPLSMGIAIASGVPPEKGLITAIIGGIIVGFFGGAPLQISGPSAGLAVLIMEMVKDHGLGLFSFIVIVAGIIQFLAGAFKLGRYFRAVSPAVIQGMLSGIGILIMASQFHVMLDQNVQATGLKNIIMIPSRLFQTLSFEDSATQHYAALIGLLTLIIVVFWEKLKPKKLAALPGPLLGVLVASAAAFFWKLEIRYIAVPDNVLDIIVLPDLSIWTGSFSTSLLVSAVALAFIASAETLLCANAVARMHHGPKTEYNQELAAQGVANLLCGLVGALPITGVISRSTANVEAGATTRFSSVLHAVWIATFVIFFPNLLALVPTSCLAAILVYVGFKLLNIKSVKKLMSYGNEVIVIFILTVVGIVTIDLLVGIVLGLVLSTLKLVYMLSHMEIDRVDTDEGCEIMLHGSATFLALPSLGQELEDLKPDSHVCFHLENLKFIDHACLDLLSAFKHRHEDGGGEVTLEWDTLLDRYAEKGQGVSADNISLEEKIIQRSLSLENVVDDRED